MEDSTASGKMDDVTGGGAGGAEWAPFLAPDAMANATFFPPASLLLSMDPAGAGIFDIHAPFPSSSVAAPALPAFHDFASAHPFDDAANFLGGLGAPPPQPQGHKGGFLMPPAPAFSAGMDWDEDGEEADASSMAISPSLENAAALGAGQGGGGGGNGRGKKKGMPAKNLMAERRRRKKLNDRLYMLRSVVPKISKMDRASILGDAIEYLKELLQRINDLHNEIESAPGSSLVGPTAASFHPSTPTLQTIPGSIKEELYPAPYLSPNGQQATVEVRIREGNAVNIHMFCARRPGILLTIMTALGNLGLDVEQAVISCFNGFAMDVFRAEPSDNGPLVPAEDIKAVLLHSAGLHNAM